MRHFLLSMCVPLSGRISLRSSMMDVALFYIALARHVSFAPTSPLNSDVSENSLTELPAGMLDRLTALGAL